MSDSAAKRPVLRDARLAIALLTVVPTGVKWPEGERSGAAAWFPAVGFVLGWTAFSFARVVPAEVADSIDLLLAALMVVTGALVTRMLHYDGLADVADAWWGGHTQERRLEIMADSNTGAFGATAVVLVAVLQVAAISTLIGTAAASLLIAPVAGRLAATIAAWIGTPARASGLGLSVMGRPTALEMLIVAVVYMATGWAAYGVGGTVGLVLAVAGAALALVVPHYISKRVGGVTGDVMGASILLVETVIVVAAALVQGVFA